MGAIIQGWQDWGVNEYIIALLYEEKKGLNSSDGLNRKSFCLFHFFIFLYPAFFPFPLLLLVVAKYTQHKMYYLNHF